MKRTVSIPVDLPSERFLPLMSKCAEIFNAHVDWALTNNSYNKNKGRKSRRQSMRRMFRARVISPSYKPHPLVDGAVD